MEQVSQRYASALFELANELKVADKWQEQMRYVKAVFNSDKTLLKVLTHYRIAKEDKKSIISNVFNDKLDKDLLNFLLLLIDKKRISNIMGIANTFNSLCNEAKNIKEGLVYSMSALDSDDKKRIEAAVSTKLGYQIELHNKLDYNLINGVKVVVGDVVFDGSMRHRLDSLKSELLKESR